MAEHFFCVRGNKIELDGVKEIITYSEKEVSFALEGKRVVISGNGLKCESVDVEKGTAILSGTVSAVTYKSAESVKGLVKRLFK